MGDKKSPIMQDLYDQVVNEVTRTISEGRILDVGTGPGSVPLKIAQNAPSLEIAGIDISHSMVEIASNNAVNMECLIT